MSARLPSVSRARRPGDARPERSGPVRGHAFHAEQAREVLGLTRPPHLGDVPASGFHIAAGVALALAAWALRQQTMGLIASVVLDVALGAIMLAVLIYHESTVTGPAGVRGGIEPGVLPVAALLALCLVLDGDTDRMAGALALVVGATTIAVVPHLDAQRRLGRSRPMIHLARQFLGVIVVTPMLVAAATTSLPVGARFAIVLCGVTAVGLDTLHVEGIVGWRALAAAAFAAATVFAVAMLPGDAAPEVHAAALLIVWYGARSVAAAVVSGTFTRAGLLEYGIVALIAGIAVRWTGSH